MASDLGVTSAKISKKIESTTDTAKSPISPQARGSTWTPIRVVELEARIRANVFTTRMVDRNRLGSCCSR